MENMSEKMDLMQVLAMGLGATIGGGIFAALGIAIGVAGNGAVITFFVAGVVALLSGYSYSQLTDHLQEEGGSYTFYEHYFKNPNVAGFSGWVLILGYIGTMALYAYAFGAFLSTVLTIHTPDTSRIIYSTLVIIILLIINLQGTALSGTTELIMVVFKIAVLITFGIIGIIFIQTESSLQYFPGGIYNKGIFQMMIAIPIIFVSFEGFELLSYEYSEMKGGIATLRKGILLTITISTIVYMLIVTAVTGILTTQEINDNEETVLAVLAKKISSNHVFNEVAYILIIIAALLSTASAINATMFGTARLTQRIARKKQLPDMLSRSNRKEVPINSLFIVSGITLLLSILGSLEQITIFASLSFLIIFTSVNVIAYRDKKTDTNQILLLLGIIASIMILGLFVYFLFISDFITFLLIIVIFIVIGFAEGVFIKRQKINNVIRN